MKDRAKEKAKEIYDACGKYERADVNLIAEALITAFEKGRRKAYEECARIFTDKADAVLKDLEKADTATAVALFTAERNSWLAIANEISRRMEGV